MNIKPARGHHGVFDFKKFTEGWWMGSAFVIIVLCYVYFLNNRIGGILI
jgi:hypothetical protein